MSASNSRQRLWHWVLLWLCLAGSSVAAAEAVDLVALGRRIYVEGLLPDGKPLTGIRFGKDPVHGREAACVLCHRRSGMGAVEGELLAAPITGNYLFNAPDKSLLATMDPRRGKSFNMTHPPYTDATLAHALRTGINVGGQSMGDLMPRYALDDTAVKALIAYLRQLTVRWSPGADDQLIHFATIITPDVEPARRKVVIDMLRMAVRQKNANTVLGRQVGGRHHMVSAAQLVLGTERKWALEVWELQGAADSWPQQLQDFYDRTPVFAVLSGVGNGNWEPVHTFCESQQLPCWFPVVDLPPEKADDFYSLYFSRGVLLEADVLASHVLTPEGVKPTRLVQLYHDDPVGRAAAAQLTRALAGSGLPLDSRAWVAGDTQALSRLLADLTTTDVAMIWLRHDELPLLKEVAPPKAANVYLSGQLLAGEHGVAAGWKKQVRLVYPYELPQKRALSLSYFHQWLRLQKLPMVDEPLQSKIFFAANFLTDTLAEMLENLDRNYLLERAENMISQREGAQAQGEAQNRQILRRAARALIAARQAAVPASGVAEHHLTAEEEVLGVRQSTTVFPRLGLASGQRFASKGAYIVRFADQSSDTIVSESEWIVP